MKKVLFILMLLPACWTAMAQWSDDPVVNNQITAERINIYSFDYRTTNDGISYIVFNRPINGYIATVLQIVDKNGVKLFPGDGKIISNEETWSYLMVGRLVFVDKDGNALLPVADCKNSNVQGTKGLSYRVYKISPEGEHLWASEGITLGETMPLGFESKMNIIQLEDKSYVFAYIRSIGNERPRIHLRRVAENGNLLELVELGESGVSYDYPYVTNTGNGQFALVYVRNSVLMAQKYDFDLTPAWTLPTQIYTGPFPGVPLQNVISVCPDPKRGVFVAWYDSRDGNNRDAVRIAHIKADGELGFTGEEGGEKVSFSGYRALRPRIIYDDKKDCLYAIWYEIDGGQTYQRLMMQKLARTGELLWDVDGLLIQETNKEEIGHYSIQQAGDQFAVFYMIQHGYTNVSASAALINGTDGSFVWTDEKVKFAAGASYKAKLLSSPLIDNSYWLTIWGDNRDGVSTENPPIYMQKVNRDASLGGSPSAIRSLDIAKTTFAANPSFVREATQFAFENPKAGTVDISIYSLSGQKAATVYHGIATQGALQIPWDKPAALSSGVYLVRLTDAEGTQKTTRIIIY